MTADTDLVGALLEEAEAIVAAEWMRLQQGRQRGERDVTERPAEMPASLPRPPRVATTTAVLGCRGGPQPGYPSAWHARRWPGREVPGTQRSPPRAHPVVFKDVVEQRR